MQPVADFNDLVAVCREASDAIGGGRIIARYDQKHRWYTFEHSAHLNVIQPCGCAAAQAHRVSEQAIYAMDRSTVLRMLVERTSGARNTRGHSRTSSRVASS